EDAALATFYLLSLAIGVTIVSVKGTNIDLLIVQREHIAEQDMQEIDIGSIVSVKGTNIDLLHVLFGNVLALDNQTLLLIAVNATISLIVLAVIYRPLVVECVD